MIAGHFQNDDECSHRRLHDAGKVACHTENSSKTRTGSKNQADCAAQSRTDRQRRCKYSARYPRNHGKETGKEFPYEIKRWKSQPFHGAPCLIVACSKGRSAGRNANDSDQKTANSREKYGIAKRGLLYAASHTTS